MTMINGETPASRLYTLDASLRPEGRQGPLARSLEAFEAYYRRWAQTWERQALLRARFIAGACLSPLVLDRLVQARPRLQGLAEGDGEDPGR